jgi:glycosyltransferase involved in cell wall biosynthesis
MSGGNKVISIYANYLKQKGHEVLIVTMSKPVPSYKQRIKDFLKLNFYSPSTLKSYFDELDIKLHYLDSFRPILNDDLPNADIVIATWWETAEWLEKIEPSKGKKFYFIQGHEVFDYLPKDRVVATYKSDYQKIVVSKWLKSIIESNYASSNLHLIPNAIDRNDFYFELRDKQKVPTIGLLISDASVKGMDVAFKVLNALKLVYKNVRVIAFGSVSLSKIPFNIEIAEYHLLPNVNEIRGVYQSCDVWLSCSRSEGFNLTAIEAMACGTPIVCTKTGWPVEVIKLYENGVLVEIEDIEALVEGVKWVLEQSNTEWKVLSRNAAMTTDGYSWEESSQKFESLLIRHVQEVS